MNIRVRECEWRVNARSARAALEAAMRLTQSARRQEFEAIPVSEPDRAQILWGRVPDLERWEGRSPSPGDFP